MVKKLKISFGALVVLLVVAFYIGVSGYWRYGIYWPYYWDAFWSPAAASPKEAYDGFHNLIKIGDVDQALDYVWLEQKDEYRKLFSSPQILKSWQEQDYLLSKQEQSDCTAKELCQERALYTYPYSIKQAYIAKINGRDFKISPGVFNYEMRFVKNVFGKWQIDE